jgi:hypothetical protein
MRVRRRRPVLALLALGGTAAVAYKLGQNNVQQIEQHTGKSFDQLSEDELTTSMDDLGIELPEEPDYLDELERLAGLRDQGIITDAEFEAKKAELLGL